MLLVVNPARLPSELTSAIPAAAAAPPRNAAGRLQNDACALDAPATSSTSPTMATIVLPPAQAVSAKPAAVTRHGMIVCQRRSRMRSALLVTTIIAPTAVA